ncbi:hypothetical protein N8I77_011425 [Diaporthe amygdali]|uniref:Nephrocystin 3-like N-terminal domain-containing protein n=1 Tax=Phomopsis amygdali TaxID=1214568 RepID=A0AAD9W114_PHOAM|nr:hypothetical protein N8I77_011425 [Diaporthe amygdali]
MERSDHISHLQGRSPAVAFIDHRLPEHDPAFLNAPSVFDHDSSKYIPLIPARNNQSITHSFTSTSLALRPEPPSDPPTVPKQTSQNVGVQSMKFWNDIFPEAMKILSTDSEEPKSLAKAAGGIRNASSWGQICARLDEAQATYSGGEGASAVFKRMRRKVADNLSQPTAHIAKMVPDIDPWTTPVAGTVGILLQAMSTAAKTRQEILASLSDLEKQFSNINSFAATFPRDQDVRQASIFLVVAIFHAAEQAIGFFLKSAGRKVAAAVLSGTDYQKELLDSFKEIQKRSDYLIQKAQNSHYAGTRAAIQEILSCENRLLAGQAQAAQQSADMKNTIREMMEMYSREKELDRKQQREEQKRRDEAQKQRDAIQMRQHQELLALVHQFQLQQIAPRPVSPNPITLALPAPPPSSTYSAPIQNFTVWTSQTLLQLLDVSDIAALDLFQVKGLESTLPQRDKRKADQVLQTELFRQWMGGLHPAKLLIHGDFRGSRTVSPLSLLTATLTEAARADQPRFVSLVFFCGCHVDPEEDPFSSGKALIKVLISQLLQQQPHINIDPSPWELDIGRAHQGDLQQLCRLFNFLVHCLPDEVTLFCLIDGAVYYERDEFIVEMQYVLAEILRLVGDSTLKANVKILITSPWRTEMVQQFFHEDNEMLHMEGMPSSELTPSASRVIDRHILQPDSDESSRQSSPEPWS